MARLLFNAKIASLLRVPVKSLVVYYTRDGNTKFVAETVAAELGSDIEEVVDMKNRAGKLGWMSAGRDSMAEKEAQIAPTKLIPADYDLIVIGTPVWAWRPTPAIRTYISKNGLSGKKVALFFAFDSSLKQAVERTKALISNADFVGDIAVSNALDNKEETQKKIVEWCNTLKTA
jgi:flavodoxin